ncbi:MAG TPA: hypothetical protein VD761_10625 [Solirubrobacterales bacterium]|nr:hypothetical protein [Solirubrobacterales bacterium]
MRPYERLADTEFEDLVGDLLGAENRRRYERFSRGSDQGIDLRYHRGQLLEVIQCKHYVRSSYAQLRSQARREAQRLSQLDSQPTRYCFATSHPLTPGNKDELATIFSVWMQSPSQVLGRNDIEALLDKYPQVERRHVKLWLAGGTALQALLNADVMNRSSALLAAIDRALPLYVQTPALLDAHSKLGEQHVCLISGRPGIGKTTLAQMLIADAIRQGYEPIEVSYDIEEAWRVLDPETPQIFYYDDFLGTTTLGELNKNEDQRLVGFIAEVSARSNARFILTTREYILQQAHSLYESFDRSKLDASKFLLTLDSYRKIDRARILYNHVYHSERLPEMVRDSLARENRYRQIVRSPLFNPRLIEAVTAEYGEAEVESGVDFVDYAASVLNDPETLWRRAFEKQLGLREHALLYALATMPLGPLVDDLQRAYEAIAATIGVAVEPCRFERALEVLDDSLVETDMQEGQHIVGFANPSVEDFIGGRLRGSETLTREIVSSAVFFDQIVGLSRLLRKEGTGFSLQRDLARRAAELLDTETVSWSRFQSSFGRRSRVRERISPEARLEFLIALLNGETDSELEAVIADRLEILIQEWDQGGVNASAALALTKRLLEDSPVRPSDSFLTALRENMVAAAQNATEHRRVGELHQMAPTAFAPGEFQRITEEFVAEAQRLLEDEPTAIESREELERYGAVAEEFGMPIEESILDAAAAEYREVEEAPDIADWEDIDYDEDKESRYEERAEEREMDALFERLADE